MTSEECKKIPNHWFIVWCIITCGMTTVPTAFVVTKRLSNVFMISHHQQGRSLIIVIMVCFVGTAALTLFIPDNQISSTIVAPHTILKCRILILFKIIVCFKHFKHHMMYLVHKCQVYPIGLNFLACTYVQ